MHKLYQKTIYLALLTLLGLLLAFILPILTSSKVIGVQSQILQQTNQELSCPKTANLTPEDFSLRGKYNYQVARFDEAINCWKNAVDAYRQVNNEEEAINNQINQSLAEQAIGFYPRACNTLLQIYGIEDCISQIQDEEKRKQFRERFDKPEGLIKLLSTPAKVAGLRILGNVFRGLGELDLSYKILLTLANSTNTLPQQAEAIWLDLGNTIRTLSNREQDFYNRNQQSENLNCAFTYANVADIIYQQVSRVQNLAINSPDLTQLQAQLNRLSIVLDLIDWQDKVSKETQTKENIFQQFSNIY
ncbi:CHAT domain-containing protein, partial [Nostoc sp. UCD120]|nr:CHAT domain-containing protein [Nostoc sp. UCD120]